MAWETSNRKATLPTNWRSLRSAILARDPICRECGRAPSTDVDHVDGAIDHRPENLQGLCHDCHQAKTIREREAKRPSRKRPRERHPGLQ